MSLAAATLAAALLAAEPASAKQVGRDVERVLEQDRYLFCEPQNDYTADPGEKRWCELAEADNFRRCPGYADVCRRQVSGNFELEPSDDDQSDDADSQESKEKPKKKPGDANRNAYEESEPVELPNLGIFAKLLMWMLLIGGVIALIYVIGKNLVRDNDADEPELDPEPDAGESLVAARAAAMRVVETDVQRLLARAEQAAGRGDYEAAINDVYAALLRRLEGEQLITVDRWKTNGDYIADLRSRPPLRDEVREIVRDVEQIQFGAAAAEQSRYFAIRTKILAVVGRAVLGLALLLGGGTLIGCRLFENDPNAIPDSAALAGLGTGPLDQRAVAELLLIHEIDAKHRTRSIEQLTRADRAIVLLEGVELVDEDWDTLIRWVEEDGGKLIIATGEAFPRELGIDYAVEEPGVELVSTVDHYYFTDLDLRAPAGRTLALGAHAIGRLLERERESEYEYDEWGGGYQARERKPYVVRRSLGIEGGEVIVFAEPDMWTNVGISVAENATFLVNLLHSSGIDEVEFVNHYTGTGPDDPFESMGNAKLGGLFLQILLFLGLLYAAVGIPFARLRDPAQQRRRSFVEHVRTLGQRYAQARASRYVAGIYSAWALDRLRERLLARTGGLHQLAQAIAARTGRDETSVMQILVAAHDVRDNSQHSTRGNPGDLELMRELARLLDETGGRR